MKNDGHDDDDFDDKRAYMCVFLSFFFYKMLDLGKPRGSRLSDLR